MTSASSKNPSSSSPAETLSAGWWRTPWMWLVVGGPAVVIVASFITLAIAIAGADPVVGGSSVQPAHLRQATGNQ
ncbi:hypothetical protein FXN63_05560 [Pigmentiphaga aceris]|uniref:Nitrogen fixation protein FixH n=1 Tax=Pigmentiphaga aceris TaxID=1940612 RepID=A0A5C0ASZ3_9BURK|nr:hypothetical protein [Pigmentiphaga aceris]QEI05368.1 hypothetical protein FXN63_05560 [Pigmentiphaga aceris]